MGRGRENVLHWKIYRIQHAYECTPNEKTKTILYGTIILLDFYNVIPFVGE